MKVSSLDEWSVPMSFVAIQPRGSGFEQRRLPSPPGSAKNDVDRFIFLDSNPARPDEVGDAVELPSLSASPFRVARLHPRFLLLVGRLLPIAVPNHLDQLLFVIGKQRRQRRRLGPGYLHVVRPVLERLL